MATPWFLEVHGDRNIYIYTYFIHLHMYIYILCRLAVSDKIGLDLKFGPLSTATTVNCKDLPSSTCHEGSLDMFDEKQRSLHCRGNYDWMNSAHELQGQWTRVGVRRRRRRRRRRTPPSQSMTTTNHPYKKDVHHKPQQELLGLNKANPLLACCSPSKVETHRTSAGRESPLSQSPQSSCWHPRKSESQKPLVTFWRQGSGDFFYGLSGGLIMGGGQSLYGLV